MSSERPPSHAELCRRTSNRFLFQLRRAVFQGTVQGSESVIGMRASSGVREHLVVSSGCPSEQFQDGAGRCRFDQTDGSLYLASPPTGLG